MDEIMSEREAEQLRVDQVISEFDKRIQSLQQYVSETKTEIVSFRKHFWDDVTVNFDNPDDAVETYASVKQQADVLSERERNHRHAQNQLSTWKRLRQSPYFGRIDFREEGEPATERIYLGISSFLDESEEHFLVYDWRSPVASLYYDYPPGPAQYETPGGTIAGTMDLKRQFVIRDGHIHSMFDTGVAIGDQLLQEVLGKHASTQMKSIVATIQKEQNKIIRNERSRLLIVQGAAGSGKTSAALQRVAYLLYRYRETLKAEQIVLFSPNPLFNSYVATVLPELGEENMQQTTFQEYLEHRLGKAFRLEDPFGQLEYVLTAMDQPGYDARIEAIRYKASFECMQAMDRFIEFLGQNGMVFRDITFRGRRLISAEYIREQFYSLDPALPIPNRLGLLTERLLDELKERARLERKKQWVEDAVELLDKEAYMDAYHKLRKKKRFTGDTFDDYALERKWLAAMVVEQHFKPIRAQVKRFRYVDLPAIYRQLFASPEAILRFTPDNRPPFAHWSDACAQTAEKLDRRELGYEDATPFLYLKERIEGFRINTSVRHVFIDEAQDYSPFQFAFLKRLFPYSKMTLLGDLNQGILAHTIADRDFTQISALFGTEQTETIILTQSYRSTRPIVEFTRQLIANGDAIQPFNREGSKPTLTQAADTTELADKIASRIRLLEAAGHRTIAVICKTAEESREAFKAMSKKLPIRLIGKETISFEPGTLVIPSYLAKGMEFDAVIIYNASHSQYGRESERKLFYTACTRAMHELHLFFVGEPSPFLAAISPDSYIQL